MNFSTFSIFILLFVIVLLIVYTMIQDKKKGKLFCGSHCSSCDGCSLCHQDQSLFEEYKKQNQ